MSKRPKRPKPIPRKYRDLVHFTPLELYQKIENFTKMVQERDEIITDLRVGNTTLSLKFEQLKKDHLAELMVFKTQIEELQKNKVIDEERLGKVSGIPYNQLFEVFKENIRRIVVDSDNFGSNDAETTKLDARHLEILSEFLHGVARAKENKDTYIVLKLREDDYEVD